MFLCGHDMMVGISEGRGGSPLPPGCRFRLLRGLVSVKRILLRQEGRKQTARAGTRQALHLYGRGYSFRSTQEQDFGKRGACTKGQYRSVEGKGGNSSSTVPVQKKIFVPSDCARNSSCQYRRHSQFRDPFMACNTGLFVLYVLLVLLFTSNATARRFRRLQRHRVRMTPTPSPSPANPPADECSQGDTL